jgi:hypothetical protein
MEPLIVIPVAGAMLAVGAYLEKMEYCDGTEPLTEEEWEEGQRVVAEFVATASTSDTASPASGVAQPHLF